MLAIARSFESTGRAVLAISVVLVAQFGLMTTSDFLPTSNFGLMVAVGLLSGQAAELLLLPALLVLKDGPRRAAAPSRRTANVPVDGAGAWAQTELLPRPEAILPEDLGSGETWSPTRQLGMATANQSSEIVLVCHGDTCKALGAETIARRLDDEFANTGSGEPETRALIVKTTCLGCCQRAPVVQVVAGHYCAAQDHADIVRRVREQLLRGHPAGEST